jgi:hypothetical protein
MTEAECERRKENEKKQRETEMRRNRKKTSERIQEMRNVCCSFFGKTRDNLMQEMRDEAISFFISSRSTSE